MKKTLLALSLVACLPAPAATYRFTALGGPSGGLVSTDVTPTATPFVFGGTVGGGLTAFGLGAGVSLDAGALVITPAWSTLTGTPTTLAGYGITDALTATTAAATYEPLIGAGTLPLSKLATDPLARANHTGTQAWSTLTGTPTTLAGYGITDAFPVASQAEAEAGAVNDKGMTPLRTAQAIAALGGGGGADVQTFTTSGLWTNPSPSTPRPVLVRLIGGGGGGGSGRKGAAGVNRSGGGGGGAGAFLEFRCFTTDLAAMENVTVTAGGGGGAAIETDSTNGAAGAAGKSVTFAGTTARGGNGGGGGTVTSGTGGTAMGYAQFNYSTVPSTLAGGGGTAGNGTNANMSAANLPTGGGGGGGVSSLNMRGGGGSGGNSGNSSLFGDIMGGAGGNSTGIPTPHGTAGVAARGTGTGGGGGSGGYQVGPAGNGAAGGGYGAGGGGGGAGTDADTNSGAGGDGAPGIAVIITY